MGLDMFAYRTKQKLGKDVNFENEEIDEDQLVKLQSWRKHPNLHGYFESVFLGKGGTGEFNCQPVVLTEDDLHKLAASLIDEDLPETSGFFFGQSDRSNEQNQEDLEFVKSALDAIKEGDTVLYDSWW
tara:strand:+ start:4852 stop:5235 length:384 start_codon:yes stop_codon:yes gene_type:complete